MNLQKRPLQDFQNKRQQSEFEDIKFIYFLFMDQNRQFKNEIITIIRKRHIINE